MKNENQQGKNVWNKNLTLDYILQGETFVYWYDLPVGNIDIQKVIYWLDRFSPLSSIIPVSLYNILYYLYDIAIQNVKI